MIAPFNSRLFAKVPRLHFVGIGGSGMSSIAEVLISQGFQVSGSDLHASATTARLIEAGATVHIGHDTNNLGNATAVVYSGAVSLGNVEIQAAKVARLPIVARATVLAELMRGKEGIAVAGTHGKTTTTSLVAQILDVAGLDPTCIIGGQLNDTKRQARVGQGAHLVAEADESDASFLRLSPMIAVVTNIDRDHLEAYGHDFDRLKTAFVEFVQRLPFYGLAVVCADDPVIRELLPRFDRPVLTYALDHEADLRAEALSANGRRARFNVVSRQGGAPLTVELNLPGRHNVANALAAIGVARELGINNDAIMKALSGYAGVGRRFQHYGDVALPGGGHFTLIDDYGHHPVEMAATLAAARAAFPGQRLVLAFQPHRFSRTAALLDEFAAVLNTADAVLLAPIYPAGEAPLPGISSEALASRMAKTAPSVPLLADSPEQLAELIRQTARNGDIVLTMGAGSISRVPALLTGVAA